MAAPSLPELAVTAFERATALTVVFHDFGSPLAAAFRPDRGWHTGVLCRAVKHVRHAACMRFDVEQAHRVARGDQQVRLKVCHAGIVEWLVGVHAHGRLCAALYAGQRRAAGALPGAMEPAPKLPHRGPWSEQVAALPPVDAAQAAWIAELFAQLAARLAAWCGGSTTTTASAPARPAREPDDRRGRILRYIHQLHASPHGLPGLARHLGLSPTRAGHLVRELCGRSYLDLRDEARMRTARELLRSTRMTIPQVAAACGFADASRFHRRFRETQGATPGAFRRAPGSAAEP